MAPSNLKGVIMKSAKFIACCFVEVPNDIYHDLGGEDD